MILTSHYCVQLAGLPGLIDITSFGEGIIRLAVPEVRSFCGSMTGNTDAIKNGLYLGLKMNRNNRVYNLWYICILFT